MEDRFLSVTSVEKSTRGNDVDISTPLNGVTKTKRRRVSVVHGTRDSDVSMMKLTCFLKHFKQRELQNCDSKAI